jgi:hypothetical protein
VPVDERRGLAEPARSRTRNLSFPGNAEVWAPQIACDEVTHLTPIPLDFVDIPAAV